MGTHAKTLDGLKILLIEDDEDTREVLTLGPRRCTAPR